MVLQKCVRLQIHKNQEGNMGNFNINWGKLTEKEAQTIALNLCSAFNVVAKCHGNKEFQDVSYLEIRGIYDDNFHAKDKK